MKQHKMEEPSEFKILKIILSSILTIVSILAINSFWVWAKNVFPLYKITLVSGNNSIENSSPFMFYAINGYVGLLGIIITILAYIHLMKMISRIGNKN